MASIDVTIKDTIDSETHRVRLPDDVPMGQLQLALLSSLEMQLTSSDGAPISYRMYHGGREIGQDETLAQAGVQSGAEMTLSQEARAGGIG